jgi:hypothetical protein
MTTTTRPSKWLMVATALASGATMFAIAEGACAQYGANYAMTAFDACWLLDCQNGAFGGAVPLCDPTNPLNNLLVDCPTTGTTTATGTTTGTTTQTGTTTGTTTTGTTGGASGVTG